MAPSYDCLLLYFEVLLKGQCKIYAASMTSSQVACACSRKIFMIIMAHMHTFLFTACALQVFLYMFFGVVALSVVYMCFRGRQQWQRKRNKYDVYENIT